MKIVTVMTLIGLLLGCQTAPNKPLPEASDGRKATPGSVVADSRADEWLAFNQDDLLYVQLDHGQVIIALQPDLAPSHVANTKALVRQGIFNDTQFYRVLDGFVAQGGPLFADDSEKPELRQGGALSIAPEFSVQLDLGDDYVVLDTHDGYADETGFYRGFAVGRDLAQNRTWLLHCYGALGMGRTNDINSGGTELYVVNGPAQRYLDRNTTVFGRVIDGMAHIQALKRTADVNGSVDIGDANRIHSIQVGSDLPVSAQIQLETLKPGSDSFKQLIQARRNRSGEWFVFQHDHMDACGMPLPVRLKK